MYDRILTDEQVIEIHRRVSNGEKHLAVAKSIGISRTTVTSIARGKIYKRFNLPPTKKREFLTQRESTIEKRFHSGYEINEKTGCWEWKRSTEGWGYGVIMWNSKKVYVHRVSYELANGPIPSGLLVLHSCDNRICCNPAHLRVGTVQDNSQDMRERLRGTLGEKSRTAKLKNEDVLNILDMIKNGISLIEIANIYSVNRQAISHIKYGRTWRHITGIQ